ncbi:hypothetical protein Ndes2526A_g01556 [Nannochloris sp. 'desiccata']
MSSKVTIIFQNVGNAPVLQPNLRKLTANDSDPFLKVITYLRSPKLLNLDGTDAPLFLYLKQAFSPQPTEKGEKNMAQNPGAQGGNMWPQNNMQQQHQQQQQYNSNMMMNQQQMMAMSQQQFLAAQQQQQQRMMMMMAAGRGAGGINVNMPVEMNPQALNQAAAQQLMMMGGRSGMGPVGVGVGGLPMNDSGAMGRMQMGGRGGGGSGYRPAARPPPPPPPPPGAPRPPPPAPQRPMPSSQAGAGGPVSGPTGREEKPDILFMTYDEYLDSYKAAKKEAQQEDQGGAAAGGAIATSNQQQQDVSLMNEDQYLEYCRNFTQQMGMPFDEAMVRRHYQSFQQQQQQQAGQQQAGQQQAGQQQAGQQAEEVLAS